MVALIIDVLLLLFNIFKLTETNEVELRRLLFQATSYDRKVCPVRYPTDVTNVHVNLILLQIESVNEKAQFVTSNIQLICAWCDPWMTWNPAKYNNITELSVSHNYLWIPDVILVNSAETKYSGNREHYALILRHDGYVRFMFQDLWKSMCKIRAKYFPFDRQMCTIIIRSGARDKSSIKFYQRRLIQRHQFIRGEWDLQASYTELFEEKISEHMSNFSMVRFTLILARNRLYYVIKIILPFSLVSCVTLFTFLLPPQTGEKLTLNVTILLSLVIYLQLLSQYIPKSEDETPLLTMFCNANFFLVFVSCIMTVYVLFLYHRPSSDIHCVPLLVRRIVLDYLAPIVYCDCSKLKRSTNKTKHRTATTSSLLADSDQLCLIERYVSCLLASSNKNYTAEIQTTENISSSLDEQGVNLLKCLYVIKAYIRHKWANVITSSDLELNVTSDTSDMKQQRLDEWQQVALVLDRLFFLIFIISMPCTALLFLTTRFSSLGNDFKSEYTTHETEDAKCNMSYNLAAWS